MSAFRAEIEQAPCSPIATDLIIFLFYVVYCIIISYRGINSARGGVGWYNLCVMSPTRPSAAGRLLAIDLFAGCGGLTTGLKKAGFKVVGAVEIDPLAVRTYRRNHRGTTIWSRDIRLIPAIRLAESAQLPPGRLDLLAGCPPCQAFSRMRNLNQSRRVRAPRDKDLLNELLRFARVLKPKAIMIENVPGLAKDRRWRQFLSGLRRLNYSCGYDVLDCADYSVPQRRRRLILLASRFGAVPFAPAVRRRKTVRHFLNTLKPAGKSGDPLHDAVENRNGRIRRLIRMIPKDGGSRLDLGKNKQLPCHEQCDGFKDVYGRMKWDDVAPTITTGCFNPSKGRFLHPSQNRNITLREAALLQSFPSTYYFDLSRGKCLAAAMIGNALPPEFVRRHALAVRRHLLHHEASHLTRPGCLLKSGVERHAPHR
jgi:DNA (cytosine-5)-methyltransferase 1